MGVNNVKKATFRTYAFYAGKTTYFVGPAGHVRGKMTPKCAKVDPDEDNSEKKTPSDVRGTQKKPTKPPKEAKSGPKGGTKGHNEQKWSPKSLPK